MLNKINHMSVLLECSVATSAKVEELKKFILLISKMGYNEFYIGLTDAYKVEGYPYFNYKRGTYFKDELLDLEKYAKSVGVTLIPSIQVLGHLDYLRQNQVFEELLDINNILEVGNPKVYEFVEAMLKSISESFIGRRVHVGMDETFGIGTGKYLLHNPPKDKKALVLEHLIKVREIARKYNLELEIWGDMLIEKEGTSVTPEMVKKELPENTIVWSWDYNDFNKKSIRNRILEMKKHADNMGFSGSSWKIASYAPHNEFSILRLINQIDVCKELDVDRFMVTLWGDNGMPTSMYSVLPSLFVAGEHNQNYPVKGNKLNKTKFKEITGISYNDFLSLDYMNNPFRRHLEKDHNPNGEAFLIFFTDLFIGNYDMLLTPGVKNEYHKLSNKYKRLAKQSEIFSHLFTMMSHMANVISLKCELGVELRKAYEENNLVVLERIANNDMNKLIKAMDKFNIEFDKYWLHEYQPLGIEMNQLWHAHMAYRYRFIKERLINYLKTGEPIQELANGTLPPCFVPPISEDHCLLNWHQWLMSYNMK